MVSFWLFNVRRSESAVTRSRRLQQKKPHTGVSAQGLRARHLRRGWTRPLAQPRKKVPAPDAVRRGASRPARSGGLHTTRRLHYNAPHKAVLSIATQRAREAAQANKRTERAARKPPPPRPTQKGTPAAGGLRRPSPFKAGPKDLQRDGCITMTLRANTVNEGATFEPEHR
jgi:hypothetical protein